MIAITLDKTPHQYCPGENISGRIEWLELEDTDRIETRLIWYTEGKGDQDVGVAVSIPAKLTAPNGNLPFELTAPSRPYSFSGKLISLIWAVEVVQFPSREGERERITISPDGEEIVLDKSYEETALKNAARVSMS